MKTYKIKAIIVEDEENTSKLLRSLLEDFCDGVQVLAEARNVQDAIVAINTHKPDLVFLDIAMPKESGFSLYKYFDHIPFEVIFTTAYNQYAVKAIKLAALDYLMKPINLEELMETLERFRNKKQDKKTIENYSTLDNNLSNNLHSKIALPCSNGYIFVEVDTIVRCQSEKSYTLFVLKNREEIWVSKNIGEYENLLEPYGFKRVHRSHLINPKLVKRFIRGKSPTLIMEDNTSILVSPNRKNDFLNDFFIR